MMARTFVNNNPTSAQKLVLLMFGCGGQDSRKRLSCHHLKRKENAMLLSLSVTIGLWLMGRHFIVCGQSTVTLVSYADALWLSLSCHGLLGGGESIISHE